MKNIALKYLEKNKSLHILMIDAIKNNHAKIIEASNQHTLIYHNGCDAYMLSSEKYDIDISIYKDILNKQYLIIHQNDLKNHIISKFPYQLDIACYNAYYPYNHQLIIPNKSIDIKPLSINDFNTVLQYYSHPIDPEYISERLTNKSLYGGYMHKKLTGFIGFHSEGTIGMMEVLPEFRRQKIATTLESFLINKCLRNHHLPMAQIEIDNTASIHLHQQLNFEISNEPVYWLLNTQYKSS